MANHPRTLGWLERYMHTVPNCNVILASEIRGGLMDSVHFETAVKATTLRHPQLRSIIDKNKLGFVELEGFVPNEAHITTIDVQALEEWKAIADAESHIVVDMYALVPLWKIILVRCKADNANALLIKFHHCIGDGSSGYIITNDVLRFHRELEEKGQIGDINPLPRLESADKLAIPKSLDAGAQAQADALLETFTRRRCEWSPSSGLRFDPNNSGEQNTTLYRDGSEAASIALLAKCREKQLTMGAVLVATTYFAIAKMDSDFQKRAASNSAAQFDFDFDMDVNLRKRLENVLGDDHVGTLIGMMSFSLSLTMATRFWDFVAQVRNSMTDFLQANFHKYYFGVNERFDASCEKLPAFQENLKRNYGLVQDMNFSSFGRYFFDPNYGRLTMDKIYCTGAGWCPTFGSCVFLILGLRSNFYTIVFSKSDHNAKVASDFFNKAVDLVESAHTLSDSYTLSEWIAT